MRNFSTDIICLETTIASKTVALNLGDQKASFYPRIYLDADIKLGADAVTAICETLKDKKNLATAVEVKMDMTGSSWAVRIFYDIWLNLS